jgi:hypothetical protein
MIDSNEKENSAPANESTADPTIQQRIGSAIATAAEYAKNWEKEAGLPDGTAAMTLGAVLGSITVAAFTKAWPTLKTPVAGVGYLVSGYALSRLVRSTYREDPVDPERQA